MQPPPQPVPEHVVGQLTRTGVAAVAGSGNGIGAVTVAAVAAAVVGAGVVDVAGAAPMRTLFAGTDAGVRRHAGSAFGAWWQKLEVITLGE